MKLWFISGACRNVGKTHLAMRLAGVLDARYAKFGHGKPNPLKQGDYYTSCDDFPGFLDTCQDKQYIIVESNVLSLKHSGDIHIYIAPPKGAMDIRSDASELKQAANIVIDSEATEIKWRQELLGHIPNEMLKEVCQIFKEQKEYIESL